MQRKLFGFTQVGLVALLGFLAVGCSDPLTREHYSQIRQNVSTEALVVKLIGDPDQDLGNRWLYERHDRGINVMIDFNDKGYVSRKQWIDANTGEWADSKPEDWDSSSHEDTAVQTYED